MDRDDKGLSDPEDRDEPTIEDLLKSHNFEKRLEEARALRQKALERRRQSGVVTSTGVLLRPVPETRGPRPAVTAPTLPSGNHPAGPPADPLRDTPRQARLRPSRETQAPATEAEAEATGPKVTLGMPAALSRSRHAGLAEPAAPTVARTLPPEAAAAPVTTAFARPTSAMPATAGVAAPARAARELTSDAVPARSRATSTLVASSFAFGLGLSIGIAGLAVYRYSAGGATDVATAGSVAPAAITVSVAGAPGSSQTAVALAQPDVEAAAPAATTDSAEGVPEAEESSIAFAEPDLEATAPAAATAPFGGTSESDEGAIASAALEPAAPLPAAPDPILRDVAPVLAVDVAPFAIAPFPIDGDVAGAPLAALETPSQTQPAPLGIASPRIDGTPTPVLRLNAPTADVVSLDVAALMALDPARFAALPLVAAFPEAAPAEALRDGTAAPAAPSAGFLSVDATPGEPVVLLASLDPSATVVLPGLTFADAPTTVPTPEAPAAAVPDAGFAAVRPDAAPARTAIPPAPQAVPEPLLPGASGYRVHIHVARGASEAEVPQAVARLADLGLDLSEPRRTDLNVRTSQVRYFHQEDAAAAAIMAETLGAQARDFTSFSPRPPSGEMEIWLGGTSRPAEVTAQPVPRAARTTQRSRPDAVSDADRARALRDQLVRRLRQGDHL